MQKYSYLIDKNQKANDKLLKYKNRKKLFSDYFQEAVFTPKSEDIESFFSNDDIFNKEYKTKTNLIKSAKNRNNEKGFQVKSSCSYLNKSKKTESNLFKIRANIINNNYNKTFDKYKYHLLHHNETSNDLFDKKKISPSCTRYNPKLDYIYKKLIYSIPFKKMCGRQKKNDINKNDNDLGDNTTKNDKVKLKISEAKEHKSNSAKSPNHSLNNYIHGSINMKYQLPRQSLPNHYDFRIRKDNYSNNNLSILEKEKDFFFEKMYKTHSGFKIATPHINNFNLTTYKKMTKISSPPNSSLNTLKKRESKSSINNTNNKENNKNADIILKNEKIKLEIEKNNVDKNNNSKLKHKNSENKKNIFKKIFEDTDNDYSKLISESDYFEFLNKKNILTNTFSNKFKNTSNKTNNNMSKKSNLYESKSCFNLYINKLKDLDNKKYKGINFEKMLSREYLDKINRNEEPIHPMITPNYSAVDPKSIMKVIYSKETYSHSPEKFHGYNGDFTYDINKIFNKYNNHISPRAFHFNKMAGRPNDSNNNILPFFMLKLFDRNSINNINEISLKMNNYSNGGFKENKSSFNDKKSFNIRLQLEELKKKDNINIMEYKNKNNIFKKLINKKIKFDGDNRIKKDKIEKEINKDKNLLFNKIIKNKPWKNLLGEFYRIDFDELDKYHSFIGTKIDGITLKSYKEKDKYPNLLTKREKKIFEININEDM